MRVQAEIVEHVGEEGIEHLGLFEFVALPRVGEQVEIVSTSGPRRFVEVVRVSYTAVGAEVGTNADDFLRNKGPSARVTVRRR